MQLFKGMKEKQLLRKTIETLNGDFFGDYLRRKVTAVKGPEERQGFVNEVCQPLLENGLFKQHFEDLMQSRSGYESFLTQFLLENDEKHDLLDQKSLDLIVCPPSGEDGIYRDALVKQTIKRAEEKGLKVSLEILDKAKKENEDASSFNSCHGVIGGYCNAKPTRSAEVMEQLNKLSPKNMSGGLEKAESKARATKKENLTI